MGTRDTPPSSGNDQRKGPGEPSAEQQRAVQEASKFNQDSRFEEWKRRMDENEPSQTNEGYSVNTVSTGTTITGDSGFHFKIEMDGIEVRALADTGSSLEIINKQFYDKIERKVPDINIEKTGDTARNASGDI